VGAATAVGDGTLSQPISCRTLESGKSRFHFNLHNQKANLLYYPRDKGGKKGLAREMVDFNNKRPS